MDKTDLKMILYFIPIAIIIAWFIPQITAKWSENISAPDTTAASSLPPKKTIEFHCGGNINNPYDLNLNCQSESF
jgi:hypothetical protein